MDLATYGAIVSTAAILLSGLGLWLHWRRHAQEHADRQPEISLESEYRSDLPPGWRAIKLTVRNLDRYSLKVESITVLWPRSARLALLDDCFVPGDNHPWDTKMVDPGPGKPALMLGMKLPAAGTAAKMSAGAYRHGDTHSVSLVVSSRPRSAHSLKVLIRQSSSSTSFKVRNRIMTARITALDEPNSTKQAMEN